jgi:peroxiredoxin
VKLNLKKKRFIRISISIVLVSLIWIILTPILFPGVQAGAEPAAAHKGFQAPDFALETPQGQIISLSDYEEKPVLVFLWASWCSVCKATMPGLQSVYQDYSSRGFEILAVNMTFQDTLSTAESYFQSQGYTYTMLLDRDGSVARDYQMHALPTSVLIDSDGTVLDVVIGSGMSEGFLRARLDEILVSGEGE